MTVEPVAEAQERLSDAGEDAHGGVMVGSSIRGVDSRDGQPAQDGSGLRGLGD
jgi:hypothetical protein